MVTAYVDDLRRAVSLSRLDKYRTPGGSDVKMAVNDFWNIALSEALYPGLAALEVSLRNSIHNAISSDRGTDLWYYEPALLEPQQLREFSNARFSLFRAHGNHPEIGRIVAELTFGFSVTLLSRNYQHTLWNPNNASLLRAVVPHFSGPAFQRQRIHETCNELRKLRNRVFHHEPVWNRATLMQDHQNIHAAIGWISPSVLGTMQSVDRFADVYANGKARIEASLKAHIGIP